MRSTLRALTFGLMIASGTAALADPADDPKAPAAASLPQSSADLVGRLFADHGWSGGPATADGGLFAQVGARASTMVATAMDFIGVPYRRGGASVEAGFDCSGFTRRVFESSLGLLLPRRASEQARAAGLTPVDRERLQPGDLVFFNTLRQTFSHVGIYLGDHKFIHSPHVGSEVRVDDIRLSYWASRFTGARRADLSAQAAVEPAARTPR